MNVWIERIHDSHIDLIIDYRMILFIIQYTIFTHYNHLVSSKECLHNQENNTELFPKDTDCLFHQYIVLTYFLELIRFLISFSTLHLE